MYNHMQMSSNKKMTTIRIDPDVRDDLQTLGKWGESQSDIIKRLIKSYKENAK